MSFLRRLPPLFWIGLFPVVVLLALWACSLAYPLVWWHSRSPEQRTMITIRNSAIGFDRTRATEDVAGAFARHGRRGLLEGTGAFGKIRPEEPRSASVMGKTWFPDPGSAPISGRSLGITFEGRSWALPLWLLLAVYLPLWWGVAWWQGRRRKRKIGDLKFEISDLRSQI